MLNNRFGGRPPSRCLNSDGDTRAVNKIFELTRDNIIAERVDGDEKLLDQSQSFNRGTVLTIIRGSHHWGTAKGIEYCTVEINGKYFNIPARVLANSIMPKRS